VVVVDFVGRAAAVAFGDEDGGVAFGGVGRMLPKGLREHGGFRDHLDIVRRLLLMMPCCALMTELYYTRRRRK